MSDSNILYVLNDDTVECRYCYEDGADPHAADSPDRLVMMVTNIGTCKTCGCEGPEFILAWR